MLAIACGLLVANLRHPQSMARGASRTPARMHCLGSRDQQQEGFGNNGGPDSRLVC